MQWATIYGEYHLAVTYCEPSSGPGETIQLLTHGLGFDREYWDYPYNNYDYSYVEEAVESFGYSTLTWDRLGVGESSHDEPINTIQAFLEIAALKELTEQLRNGDLPGLPCRYEKVVHVGHGYGSILTYALTQMYPIASDGIILTGFSHNTRYMSLFALALNIVPANTLPGAESYPPGYLAVGTEEAIHIGFFGPGQVDSSILGNIAQRPIPFTIGELLTASGLTQAKNAFVGPVLIVTGGMLAWPTLLYIMAY
jgi:pimeloyl-ACP methyl ester carboxylesterase